MQAYSNSQLCICYCSEGRDGLAEWGIIELQGDLEVRGDELMNGQFVGDLNYDKYGQPVNIRNAIELIHVHSEYLFHFSKLDSNYRSPYIAWKGAEDGEPICRSGENDQIKRCRGGSFRFESKSEHNCRRSHRTRFHHCHRSQKSAHNRVQSPSDC